MGKIDKSLEAEIRKRSFEIRQYFESIELPKYVDELCRCGCMRSEHADSNSLIRGHGHCLRCDCKQFTWKSFVEATEAPRMAIFVLETQMNDKGEYNALIAVEGESGYYKTDWYWGKDFKVAEEIADERNARMGLSKKDAATIVCSTMRGMKMPEAETDEVTP